MAFGSGLGGLAGGGGGSVIGGAAVRLLLDAAQFEKGLTSAQARIQRFGKGMSTAGGALTRGLTLPLAGAAVAAIKLASDAGETENKLREIFGGMSDSVIAWSNTSINKMGAARATAQDMASTFGLLFSSAKLPAKEVVRLSEKFTQLSADASSFFNVDFQTSLDKLRSGLAGESEPLRDFGVFLNEAAVNAEGLRQGLIKQGQTMTEGEKITARAALITQQMATASGDFARTQDSVANQSRKAREQLKQMAADIGKDLLPVAKDALEAVQGLLKGFMNLSEGTRENILKFGLLAIALGPVLRLLGSLAVLASPGGVLLVGLGGLAAAIIYAQGATERYEQAVELLAEKLKRLKGSTHEFDRAYVELAGHMLEGSAIIREFGEQSLGILEDAHKKVRSELTKQLEAVKFLNTVLQAHNTTLTVGEQNSINSAIASKNYALAARLLARELREAKGAVDAQGRGMDALSRNSNDAANATEAVIRAQKELARILANAEQKVKNMDQAMFNLAERFRNMPSPPNVTPSGGGGGGGGGGTGPLPTHHMGGPINRSGPALLQAGEFVLSKQMVGALSRPGPARGGDINISIDVHGDIHGDEFARKVEMALSRSVSRFAGV